MSLVLTFTLVRTGIRGKPDQLNSLLPACEMVERGSKVGYEKGVKRLSPVLLYVPTQGKEDRGGPIKPNPHFHPQLGRSKGK